MGGGRTLTRRFVGVPLLPPHGLFGRDEVIGELRARVCTGSGAALGGLPGVGKTTLATALAHDREVLEHFRGGVLWAGLGPNADVDGSLDRWAAALGVDPGAARDAGERA